MKNNSDSTEREVVCIILAAGSSQRFGSAKMLHLLGDGQPMIVQTIARYSAVFEQLIVVCREDDSALANLLESQSVSYVNTADKIGGMSQSIIAGIGATLEADGWLIALGDMPYVQSKTIEQLKQALTTENIVLPRVHQRLGNPVGFGKTFKQKLLNLKGDRGAKSIVKDAQYAVELIDTDDEGVLLDIDYLSSVL